MRKSLFKQAQRALLRPLVRVLILALLSFVLLSGFGPLKGLFS